MCFSNDELKRALGLFHGFVSAIASAPCSFLYLNNEYLIIKKKLKKRRKKENRSPIFSSTLCALCTPSY